MHTLRQKNGLSGFTSRFESEYDPFGAAHGCNSISAGLGNVTFGFFSYNIFLFPFTIRATQSQKILKSGFCRMSLKLRNDFLT